MSAIKIFKTVTALLLVAWMVLIFCMSAQNAEQSSQTSGGLIEAILSIFHPRFSTLSNEARVEIISSFQFIVRKTAHFSIYGVLGLFSFSAVIGYKSLKFSRRAVISGLICLSYAVSDELHQLFVPGRSCEIRDICIDFCGSLLLIILSVLTAKFNRRLRDLFAE